MSFLRQAAAAGTLMGALILGPETARAASDPTFWDCFNHVVESTRPLAEFLQDARLVESVADAAGLPAAAHTRVQFSPFDCQVLVSR